jgi:hypothetical protein
MDVSAFFCFVLSYVGSGFASGRCPIQETLPTEQQIRKFQEINSEQAKGLTLKDDDDDDDNDDN